MLNILKAKAQVAMTHFLVGVNRETDVDSQYETFMKEFVGDLYDEELPWWDFSEDLLTVKDFNELLCANADMLDVSRTNQPPWPPRSVKELLRRYGIWAFRQGHRKEFGSMFLQAW